MPRYPHLPHRYSGYHLQALYVQVDCVKALLEAKADVKVFAMDDMNAMHFAAQKGHAEVVRLLLNHGANFQG